MKFTSKDVNVQDDSGNTPLYYTFANKNYDFSEFLLSRGALVNIKCENGNTPAFKAFQTNDLNVNYQFIN
jgi:ankyrin repeat protein